MLGDDEFERSRGRAQEAHDRQEKELITDWKADVRTIRELVTTLPM